MEGYEPEPHYRPRYEQPHNIDIYVPDNPALQYILMVKEHGRQKYRAKYWRSKFSKRIPGRSD